MAQVITIRVDTAQLGEDDADYVRRQLADDVREFVRQSIGLPEAFASAAIKVKSEAQ